MGSAIGDYIHATSLGYCQHGVNKTPFYEPSEISQIVQKRERHLVQ